MLISHCATNADLALAQPTAANKNLVDTLPAAMASDELKKKKKVKVDAALGEGVVEAKKAKKAKSVKKAAQPAGEPSAAEPAAAIAKKAATQVKRKREGEEGSTKTAATVDEKPSKSAKSTADGGVGRKAASNWVSEAKPLDDFPSLSEAVKSVLRSQSILTLFPIQAMTLDYGVQGEAQIAVLIDHSTLATPFHRVAGARFGKQATSTRKSYPYVSVGLDMVGRARTGCGKTLAFVLPIVERQLIAQREGSIGARVHGRLPSVIVLAPTRELAKQVGMPVIPSTHAA